MGGLKHMEDIHRVYLNNEFPGCCYVRSKNLQRYIFITIKFDWSKWDTTIQLQNDKNLLEFNMMLPISGFIVTVVSPIGCR